MLTASSSSTLPISVRLTDRSSFPTWFAHLRFLAQAHGVWEYIDPDVEDRTTLRAPELPDEPSQLTGDALQFHMLKQTQYNQRASKIQLLWNWVIATVEPQRIQLASISPSDGSLATLIKELKEDLCPNDDDWKEQVLDAYQEITRLPLAGKTMTPEKWIEAWFHAYTNAKIMKLEAIQGRIPIKDFLQSAARYFSTWAVRELEELDRPGRATAALSLENYARWFKRLSQNVSKLLLGVYATLGGRSDRTEEYQCPYKSSGTHK